MCLSFCDGTFIILSLYDPSDLIDLNVTCIVGVLMDPAFMTLDLPMVIVIRGVSLLQPVLLAGWDGEQRWF